MADNIEVGTKRVLAQGMSAVGSLEELQVDAQKNLLVGLRNSTGGEPGIGAYTANDGNSAGLTGMLVHAFLSAHNGVNMDRWRNNTEGPLLASAARTATTPAPIQTNYNARGVVISLNISVAPATAETLTLVLRQKDPVSGNTAVAYAEFVLPAGTAVITSNPYRLIVYPGASGPVKDATFFKAVALPLPRTWYVDVIHSGASSWTYSVGYQYIV